MAKYHVNGRGEPGACKAKKRPCPYGGAEDHYESKEEAAQAFEKKMEAEVLVHFKDDKAGWADEQYREKVARKRRVEDAVISTDPNKTVRSVPHNLKKDRYDGQRYDEYYVHPDFRKKLPDNEDFKEYLISVHHDDLTPYQLERTDISYDKVTGVMALSYPWRDSAPEYDEDW